MPFTSFNSDFHVSLALTILDALPFSQAVLYAAASWGQVFTTSLVPLCPLTQSTTLAHLMACPPSHFSILAEALESSPGTVAHPSPHIQAYPHNLLDRKGVTAPNDMTTIKKCLNTIY